MRPGWTLAPGATPSETSAGAYRFAIPVAAKAVATLVVEEVNPIDTNYAISQLTGDQISVFVHDTRENTVLMQALRPILAKKAEIGAIFADMNTRQAEANKIGEDQHRLRENMATLKNSAGEQQLLKWYVAELTKQEDRIAVLRKETTGFEQKLAKAEAELSDLINALALDLDVAEADRAPALPGALDPEER